MSAETFPSPEAVEAEFMAMIKETAEVARISLGAALPAIPADERERMKTLVEQVILGHIGKSVRPAPESRAEWGPDCAGCGNTEFRHDGYCSIRCRDSHAFAADILAALNGEGQ